MRITEGTLNPKPISSPPSLAPTYLFVDRSQSCREMLCRLLAFPDSSLFSFLFFFLFVPYIFELSSEYHIDARFSFFLLCNLVVLFFVKTVILNHSRDFFLWVACFFLFFSFFFFAGWVQNWSYLWKFMHGTFMLKMLSKSKTTKDFLTLFFTNLVFSLTSNEQNHTAKSQK